MRKIRAILLLTYSKFHFHTFLKMYKYNDYQVFQAVFAVRMSQKFNYFTTMYTKDFHKVHKFLNNNTFDLVYFVAS